ncbi:MAG: hypothetical protein Q9190_006822 [Brigantiaea leucoxantha]
MADSIQNANPTIRNASDLPTRRDHTNSKSATKHRFGLLASVVPAFAYTPDPFDPSSRSDSETSDNEDEIEPIDEQEIYDLIAPMTDPEHPFTLGSLSVVNLPDISLAPTLPSEPDSPLTTVTVLLTPTITGCSLATVIGLGVRIRLERALPPRFRVDVRLKEGSHHAVEATNRQLADKERVAAAMENRNLMGVVGKMLEGVDGYRTSLMT